MPTTKTVTTISPSDIGSDCSYELGNLSIAGVLKYYTVGPTDDRCTCAIEYEDGNGGLGVVEADVSQVEFS